MASFLVEWSIDIDEAEDFEDAARQAYLSFIREGSIAHVFDVTLLDGDGVDQDSTQIDLDAIGLPEEQED